jgi:hypothetical protein
VSDSFISQTLLRQPTVIRTVEVERVVIRALPAPGPQGPQGSVSYVIDGGGPASDLTLAPVIDGGTP